MTNAGDAAEAAFRDIPAAQVLGQRRAAASLVALLLVVVGAGLGVRTVTASPASVTPTPAVQRAAAVAEYAVYSVPLPRDARAVAPVLGLAASRPAPRGGGVHRTAWFAAGQPPEVVGSWILRHAWDSGWAPWIISDARGLTMVLVWFGRPNDDDSSGDPVLHLRVVARGGGSIVRVDGWQLPVRVPSRSTTTLLGDLVSSVSLGRGGGDGFRSTLTVSGERVRRVAEALDALPLSWSVDGTQCVTSSSLTLTFHRAGHTLVFADAPACGFVRVMLDGSMQPPLTALNLPVQQAISALQHP